MSTTMFKQIVDRSLNMETPDSASILDAAPTKHWLMKVKTAFQRLDYNEDGVLSREDFEKIAVNFAEYGGLDEEEQAELVDISTKMYVEFFSTDARDDDNHQTNLNEFVHAWVNNIESPERKRQFRKLALRFLNITFDILDRNHDGVISGKEYRKFMTFAFSAEEYSDSAFESMDENHDGEISLEEFTESYFNFWFGLEETHHSYRLGPLVEY